MGSMADLQGLIKSRTSASKQPITLKQPSIVVSGEASFRSCKIKKVHRDSVQAMFHVTSPRPNSNGTKYRHGKLFRAGPWRSWWVQRPMVCTRDVVKVPRLVRSTAIQRAACIRPTRVRAGYTFRGNGWFALVSLCELRQFIR